MVYATIVDLCRVLSQTSVFLDLHTFCRYRIDRIPFLNHVRTGGANSFLKDNRADDLRQGRGHA